MRICNLTQNVLISWQNWVKHIDITIQSWFWTEITQCVFKDKSFSSVFSSASEQTWATWWSLFWAAAWTNMISVNNLDIRNVLTMFVPGLNLFSYVVSTQRLMNGFITPSVYLETFAWAATIENACWYFIIPKVNIPDTMKEEYRLSDVKKEMRKSFMIYFLRYKHMYIQNRVWTYFAT